MTAGPDAPAVGTTVELPDAASAREYGRALAQVLRAGDLVVLTGRLGAGKTTLTQGIGEGLGVRGQVASPTFIIARVHPSTVGGPALVHVDAYRLGSLAELDALDLDTGLEESVTVVEWGEGLAEVLSEDRLEVTIDRPHGAAGGGDLLDPETGLRRVTVRGVGQRWAGVPLPVTGGAEAAAGPWPGGPPWWTSAVVYQVYPRSFADSDGDGIGDLRGIADRLDHLERLGVDVIWLSPVYRSPQDDNGYDISDYQSIDPTFGSLDDLDALLADVHRRGMRLVMDLVVNHTSDEHPWFVASRSSKDDPKRDWYWWRPPRPGMEGGAPGAEPNNWAASFSGPAWDLDPASGEYYLHIFSPRQPDLNWENPEVRAAVHAMMRWWLDRGVDGFRMDVINFISKDPDLPDGPVPPGRVYGDGGPHYGYGPRLHEFLSEMHREVFTGRPDRLLTVGEMPGATVEQAVLFTDPARGEVDMVFQFEHVGLDHGSSKWDVRPLRLTDLKASFGRWQAGLAETGWNSLYWENHDQPRVVSRFGDDGAFRVASATALATLLHLHRGTPYVYQGEEIGMTNSHFTRIDQYRDIESLNHHREAIEQGWATEQEVLASLAARSRDNARTPMQWDDSPNAGFSAGEPWIEVNPNHTRINVAAQVDDPASVLAHYQRLIALRHTEPAVALGDFTMLMPLHEQVYAFTRTLGPTALLVLVNVSGDEQAVDLPDPGPWADAELVLGNLDGAPPAAAPLRPWEARVHRLRRAAG